MLRFDENHNHFNVVYYLMKQGNYSTVRGDGDVGPARYEQAPFSPCSTIKGLNPILVNTPLFATNANPLELYHSPRSKILAFKPRVTYRDPPTTFLGECLVI